MCSRPSHLDRLIQTLFYNSVTYEGWCVVLDLSTEALRLAGILLLALVTVESGGWYLTRIARGMAPSTEFQRSFARAGHGHAGMFLTLGLVAIILSDATALQGAAGWIARSGSPPAAILLRSEERRVGRDGWRARC